MGSAGATEIESLSSSSAAAAARNSIIALPPSSAASFLPSLLSLFLWRRISRTDRRKIHPKADFFHHLVEDGAPQKWMGTSFRDARRARRGGGDGGPHRVGEPLSVRLSAAE